MKPDQPIDHCYYKCKTIEVPRPVSVLCNKCNHTIFIHRNLIIYGSFSKKKKLIQLKVIVLRISLENKILTNVPFTLN